MDLFAWVVGAKSASWRSGVCDANSPTPQFAHIVFHPYYEFTHVDGRIAIRPYACVIRTLANIYANSITGMA